MKSVYRCAWCEKKIFNKNYVCEDPSKMRWVYFCSQQCKFDYKQKLNIYRKKCPKKSLTVKIYKLKEQEYICEMCKKKHNGFYGSGRFCCKTCAKRFGASVNKEAIKKTSETLKRKHFDQTKEKLKHVSKDVKFTITGNKIKIQKTCKLCGKFFEVRYRKRYQKCCSNKCSAKLKGQNPEYRKKLSDNMKQRVKNGTHSGWKSREGLKPSFAEQFFIKVLNNNKIYFKREHKYSKYFLDFLIEKNERKIDIEVDGKQHKYPARAASDKIRDKFLIKEGFEVYRIKWKHPKKHSDYIKKEIDKLLEYINKVEII